MIDTHAHIYAPEFDGDRKQMLERTFAAGVTRIYMPNIDHTSIEGMLALAKTYPDQCLPMMGLHPCYVNASFEKELQLVEDWLAKHPFSAVGEIGLDFYWSTEFRQQQEEAFRFQVKLAKKHQLPIVIHCRNSFDETVALLKEIGTEGVNGIFHCFTGNLSEASQVIGMGFLLGIGGVSTFKNGGLDQVLPHVALEHIVLETDSPYLAPVPFRGKRNETAYLPIVAQRVADLKQTSLEEVNRITTQNALALFGRNDLSE
ncbi:TatD family hydrolase [Rhodocytophaga rosea]|uniref:TatD family hydrolase n=1 Tax=Rhodocytophaga rosea TaxID=2704465 RepID=A0A6C0GFK1_9BACT|nr:TatD family hydrolase [Rhodocytophaga rosea]QHT66532.1 TatD family hydrolase [Rhodocytophaga rosea]